MQQALSENRTQRIGLLVNDMSAINIDSKLLKRTNSFDNDLIDTLELQNGCVCCSLADDMMVSIRQFVHMSEEKNVQYDHIILECSGIAEPRRVREIFRELVGNSSSGLSSVALDTFVTVIDAKVFRDYFGSAETIGSHRQLAVGTNFDWDAPDEEQLGEMVNSDYLDEASAVRCVTELLLEQVECADVILVNKIDLLDNKDQDISNIVSVIQVINPSARIELCEYGAVKTIAAVIGSALGRGVAALDIVKEHKQRLLISERAHDHSHIHSAHKGDDTHSCSHNHDHAHSHLHGHTDDGGSEETTALRRFGISSFVYKRRKPFHPIRFYKFIESIGKLSFRGLPDWQPSHNSTESEAAPFREVLIRSKGFVWLSSSAETGYYLSHSGQFLEMNALGNWWDSLPMSEWPVDQEAIDEIKLDFEDDHGDRRQELIFIGQFKNSAAQESMEKELDACLLTDEEMRVYIAALSAEDTEKELQNKFVVDEK